MSHAINQTLFRHASKNTLLLTLNSESISVPVSVLLTFDEQTSLLSSVDTNVEFEALGVFAKPLPQERVTIHGEKNHRTGERKVIYDGPAILSTHLSAAHVLFPQSTNDKRAPHTMQHVLYICPKQGDSWPIKVATFQQNQQLFNAIHGSLTLPKEASSSATSLTSNRV